MSEAEIHKLSDHRKWQPGPEACDCLVSVISHTYYMSANETETSGFTTFCESGQYPLLIESMRDYGGFWTTRGGSDGCQGVFIPWPPAAILFEPMSREEYEKRIRAENQRAQKKA